MIPFFSPIRRLIILAVIAGGLFVGASVVVQDVAEQRLAASARRAFSLAEDPVVTLDAFPILLRLVQGTIPTATIDAENVRADEALTLSRLHVELSKIRLDGGSFVGDPESLGIVVEDGEAVAEADEDQVNAFLAAHKVNVKVAFDEGIVVARTRRFVYGRMRDIVARGKATLSGRNLVFKATSVTVDGRRPDGDLEARAKQRASFSVALPPLPGNLRLGSLEVHEGFVRMTARVKDFRLKAPDQRKR